jgi:glycosyltransferase involved in cell wall biosynthesis
MKRRPIKLRVLTVSKPYVAAAYRNKLTCLQDRGDFEIGLVCPPAWGQQKFEHGPDDQKIWIKQLPIRFNGHNHLHWYVGLGKAALEFKPDIMNIEEEHYSLVTAQAFHVAKKVGAVPLFYTWQNIHKNYPPPFSWIERHVFANAGAAVCGNDESIQVLRRKGWQGLSVEIPQMGVTRQTFLPESDDDAARASRKRALGFSETDFVVLFAGRLVSEKGVQDLIAAAKMLHSTDHTKTRKIRVAVLGSGPEADNLKALAQGAPVSFHAAVSSNETATWLKTADVLCLPSLTRPNWKEQFGRVLIEAMIAGAVTVGSSSGEIPRVISDCGRIFPEGDAATLARVLGELSESPALVRDLRQKARERALAKFTNQAIADKFGDLFHLIWSNRKAAR